MAAVRRATPDHPTPGKFPTISYEYDESTREHKVSCSCKETCATTAELVARRFVTSHMGEHARLRIVTPAEAIEVD